MKNILLVFALIVLFPVLTAAQGNAFSFQGRLNDGANPANGSYDLQFRLFNAITGGNPIGSLAERPNTTLINGVFSVTLDFGATAFNNPNAVFIEIGVKPNGSPNAFTILGPRQQLTVVPFAVRAQNATNADNATNAQNAVNATNATNAATAANSNTLNGLNSSDFIRNSVAPGSELDFRIAGSGVINGILEVTGTISGTRNLNISEGINSGGNVFAAGDVAQNRNSNGLVKAMLSVALNGSIIRCYNSVTGSSTGNCGISVEGGGFNNPGTYTINFPFQVNDRFVSVVSERRGGNNNVNIAASYGFVDGFPNRMLIKNFITDVDFNQSQAANAFMVIVY